MSSPTHIWRQPGGVDSGNAVVAFTNPGGIRDDIRFGSSGTEADGELTYGEAFGVQPFGNSLVTMTLTGAQIDALLEQQFDGPDTGYGNMLQASAGFSYTWDAAAPVGSGVNASSIAIDGVAIEPGGRYRVTVNSYLADGGSGFSVLAEGSARNGGGIDLDTLAAYFAKAGAVAQDRITRLNRSRTGQRRTEALHHGPPGRQEKPQCPIRTWPKALHSSQP